VSSVAFAFFGTFVCGFGSIEEGYRIGRLALTLTDKFETDVWLSRVSAAFYGVVMFWREPAHHAFEPLKHAYRLGLAVGDVEFALINGCLYPCTCHEIMTLSAVNAEISDMASQMDYYGQTTLKSAIMPHWQMIQNMMGLASGDPKILSGNIMDINHCAELFPAKRVFPCIEYNSIFLAYFLGDFDAAEKYSEKIDRVYSSPFTGGLDAAFALFYKCMTLLAQARRKRLMRYFYLRTVRRLLRKLKTWAFYCPENFLAKQCLLQAEMASVTGNLRKASEKYRAAILLSRESKFLFQEGLANELFGKHYLYQGKKASAVPFLQAACQLYGEWGGVAKLKQLQEEMENHSISLL